MAVLLDEFASKLAGILAGMVKEEMEMLLGVPGEITKLDTTLRDLSSILGDAERKRIRDSATERWVKELKDVMYDADDVLDLCQLMEGGEGPSAPTSSAPKTTSRCWDISKMFFCFRNPVVAHEIGRKIQAINQRLEDLARRSSRFGFITQAINSSADSINKASNFLSDETGSVFIQSDVVGERIEEDTEKIVDLLIKKVEAPVGSKANNDVVVAVAITGTGGIGKTTLAKMVFGDSRVEENFEERIWLSVNKEFNETNVLQSLIASFGGKHEGCVGNKDLLQRALKDTVRQRKKFLLVMDDVWNENVWHKLLIAPLSHGAAGSQILVTTRNFGVARGMNAQYLHRVDKLQIEDAWILLKNQVVSNESDKADVNGLKDIGMEIVEKCDCLPLAVKVLGGLLRRKNKTRDVWKNVSSHSTWLTIETDEEDINKAVYLSYEDLPSHLKQCFVYCSLFPKDELIRRNVIIQLWIAEGYIPNKMTLKALEDLGKEYYEELISRNLLEPNESCYGHGACNMHDVIRSFTQHIMRDEGVVFLISEGQDANRALNTPKLRHLSISNKAVGLDMLQKQASLRTLMIFGSITVELKDLLNNLSCLRVLYLKGVNLVELPDSICHLKHLRYLSLVGTTISTVPRDIGDLKFLQAIVFKACSKICQLPDSILKLRKLRSLNLRGMGITSVPRGFRELEDLINISGFPTWSDDSTDGWCSLEELGPLSKLRLLEISCLEKAPSGSVAAKAMLSSKHELELLVLIFTSRLGENGEVEDIISEEEHVRIEEVLANLCPPTTCLQSLDIKGYFARGLPRWMRTMAAFGSLRRLALFDYACCTQLPTGLGQLPCLDYFWVERAPSVRCVGHDFLHPSLVGEAGGKGEVPAVPTGTRNNTSQPHHTSHGAGVVFPKLKEVGFVGMLGWTEWEWEQHVPAMPALDELTIRDCKLQRLPAGLAQHACRLRELQLINVQHLVSVENFPSLVKLWSYRNPMLERISNNPSLRWIDIRRCRALKELDGLTSLRSLEWWDLGAKALPEYLREAKLKKLRVDCSRRLLKLIALQDESSEWGKIQHVQQLKACGHKRKGEAEDAEWYINYTKEPYSFDVYLGEPTDE